jgi:hypothetical protein
MKIWMKIAVILFGIVLITFLLLNDYLPPRTPIKVAKIHSGLRISKSATVIYFKEDYAFTGEGQVEMKIKIAKSDIEDLEKECLKSGFKTLTTDNLIESGFLDSNHQYGFKIPNTDLRNINKGLYKLNATDMENQDFSITVLNLDNNELSIWTLIP